MILPTKLPPFYSSREAACLPAISDKHGFLLVKKFGLKAGNVTLISLPGILTRKPQENQEKR
jgi:hypothetical protein